MPVTVQQVVDEIIAELPLKDRIALANMDDEKIHVLELTLEMYIQKKLDEWVPKQELLESCKNYAKQESLEPVSAPTVIVRLLWEKLRETHRLRVVK